MYCMFVLWEMLHLHMHYHIALYSAVKWVVCPVTLFLVFCYYCYMKIYVVCISCVLIFVTKDMMPDVM